LKTSNSRHIWVDEDDSSVHNNKNQALLVFLEQKIHLRLNDSLYQFSTFNHHQQTATRRVCVSPDAHTPSIISKNLLANQLYTRSENKNIQQRGFANGHPLDY
jgi:hypothetical protein